MNIMKSNFAFANAISASTFAILLMAMLANYPRWLHAQDELQVLQTNSAGIAPGKQLELWLKSEFYQLVDQRTEAFEKMIKSEAACRSWQAQRKAFFLKQIGPFPERNPLNAQVVGRLVGRGYSVEKIVLESRPGFHVTANLYLPNTPPPWPAVLVPCGHSHEGKASGQYQRASILLAKHGMAAMCYDPVGQGERYQMLDLTTSRTVFDDAPHVKTPHPNVRFLCTIEHTMMGLGCTLVGANIAQFRIWDGMRVIDYLQSRPDILADKIGCAGNSGGGTETAYLMALDERIAAASPGGFLTTYRRLIDGQGPQDGEQNIFAQIAFGMDEADYCIMRAPKPTLICNGMRETTFDIRGTWQLFFEAKRVYSRLRRGEAIDINIPDAPHGFTFQQREAVASWMHRWLLGSDKIIREVETLPDTLSDEELRKFNDGDWTTEQLLCTPAGQVLLLPGERTVFDINTEFAQKLREQRTPLWEKSSADEKRQMVRSVIGLEQDPASPATKIESVGKLMRDGFDIHKVVMQVNDQLSLPALVYVPTRSANGVTLYFHGSSIAANAGPGSAIEGLVRQGRIVVSAELRGIGETETGHDKREWSSGRFGRDNLQIFLAYLIGKSYVGMRTEDIWRWHKAIPNWFNSESIQVPASHVPSVIATGEAAIAALHAVALHPGQFGGVSLHGMLASWETIVSSTQSHNQSVNVVHGALTKYDLPNLIELTSQSQVKLIDPVNAMNTEVQ